MNTVEYSRLFLLALELTSFATALGTLKYHNAVFRLFFFDLFYICLLEGTGAYIGTFYPQSKFPFAIGSLFILVEIPIIYLSALKLQPNYFFKKFAGLGLIAFLALWIRHAVLTKLTIFPTFLMLYASIFALTIFLAILIRLIGQDNIFKQPLFYFCLGMLIFYGCTIPYIGVVNYFDKVDNTALKKLAQILFISNYVRYSLIAISYVVLYRQEKAKKLKEELAKSP